MKSESSNEVNAKSANLVYDNVHSGYMSQDLKTDYF